MLDTIAGQLPGYNPDSMNASDVSAFLARMVTPVSDAQAVDIHDSLGRVLAADIRSPVSVPPHDNSAMDGYAFAGGELKPGQPLELKVVGTALAGKAWRGEVHPGECVKVMTGAVMPAGLDTVAPQELVAASDTAGCNVITVPAGVLQPGDNRRLCGEDIQEGQTALHCGERLTPAALGLIASLGIQAVPVWRKLRVAYFSTGDEILSLGESPREGAVYDSNRYTVFGLLSRMGVEMIDMGVVRDEPQALESAFSQAAAEADAIITSGGVSAGDADHTRIMMQRLAGDAGGGVVFWRIAMRPGRPMAVGLLPRSARSLEGKSGIGPHGTSMDSYTFNSTSHIMRGPARDHAVLFGLPGNPVAVMVTFLAFVRPALLQMMGCTQTALPLLKAISSDAIRKKAGRTEYQRGIVSTSSAGTLQVRLTGSQGSGMLSSMTQANGLIVLHHDQGNVLAGDEVDVMMFDGAI